MADRVNVLMVCLGNICRSPVAASVFNGIVKERGLESKFYCESAGIGSWHVGEKMDPRSAAVLLKHGLNTDHTARQVTKDDFGKFDYIFGMDQENIRDLEKKAPSSSNSKIQLLGNYIGEGTIIRDPYYDRDDSGFEDCYKKSYEACTNFLDEIMKN